MKIQLTFNEQPISDHIWASPFNSDLKENFYKCWEYCMEAQCVSLYGPSALNMFTVGEIEKLVPQWAKLIAPGGKMLLGGIDFYITARSGVRRSRDLLSINNLLFSKDYNLKSITSAESTRKFMEDLNFKINDVKIDYNECGYTVEGIKNG